MMTEDHNLPILQAGADGTIASVLGKVEPSPGVAHAYIHIPFCFHKCHYCDFYSLVQTNYDSHAAFVDRLAREIETIGRFLKKPLDTLYIGGGTPTLLGPALWQRLIRAIHANLGINPLTEWTVEANPETVTDELASTLAEGGVNRISIGCQTFSPIHLRTLERWHEPSSVSRTVDRARAAGIRNISLDLIFAIPGQTMEQWQDDLRQALELEPDHLSCYALTFEPGTPLSVKRDRGDIMPADEDLEADMFTWTRRHLADQGFDAYEISNFARPGKSSRHNLAYWLNDDWLAFGPSAASHVCGYRWKNVPSLSAYLQSPTPWPPITDLETPDPTRNLAERLMMGLRLSRGLPLDGVLAEADHVGARTALSTAIDNAIVSRQLVIRPLNRLSLTDEGLILADSVIHALMSAIYSGNK